MSNQALPMGNMRLPEFRPETIAVTKVTVKADKPIILAPKILPEIKTLAQLEVEHIEYVLGLHDNKKALAAKSLGVTIKTLYNKLHFYGLFEKYKR